MTIDKVDQIEIYVRSSALGPVGIHWRNVSKPEQPKEEPEILTQQVVLDEGSKISIDSAINTVKPCLVLAKYDGKVLLEVTGIDATRERCEQEGRRISEVVLWVGVANEETEKQLRKLAHCALLSLWEPESKFRAAISSSIEFDGLNDYKVDAKVLKKIYDSPEEYTEELSSEVADFLSYDYLKPQKLETAKDIAQLAVQLREASFGDMETAVVISEVKQTESKRWLNNRGNVAEILEVKKLEDSQDTPSTSGSEYQENSLGGDVFTGKKPQSKASTKKHRSRLMLVVTALVILILMTLLWAGQKYFSNYKETMDQDVPMLNVVPTME